MRSERAGFAAFAKPYRVLFVPQSWADAPQPVPFCRKEQSHILPQRPTSSKSKDRRQEGSWHSSIVSRTSTCASARWMSL
jgi:hypothetical protein